MLPAVVGALSLAMTVTIVFPEPQNMIPHDEGRNPCCEFGKCSMDRVVDCNGGFPGIAAAYREAAKDTDHLIRLGQFLQSLEQLIDEHPLRIKLNEVIWRRIGVDVLLVDAPYIYNAAIDTATTTAEYLTDTSALKVVATNVNDTLSPLRSMLRPFAITEAGGVKVGIVSLFRRDFWAGSVPIAPYLQSLVVLIRTMGAEVVVAVVQLSEGPLASEDTRADIADLLRCGVDVVMWGPWADVENEYPDVAYKETFTTRGADNVNRTTWVLRHNQTASLYNIQAMAMTFRMGPGGRRELVDANVKVYSSEMVSAATRDAAYRDDEAFVVGLVGEFEDHVLGYSTAPMPYGYIRDENGTHDNCRHKECHLGTWASNVVVDFRPTTDIALINAGGLRSGWDTGDITRSELNNAIPFKNPLCYVKMTAVNIWRELEHGVAVVTERGEFNVSAPITGRFMQVGGLRYGINPTLPPGRRITRLEIPIRNVTGGITGWTPIDAFRVYEVVTVGYVCAGGDLFTMPPVPGTSREITDINWWSALAASLREEPLTPAINGAITYNFTGVPINYFAGAANECTPYETYIPLFEACKPCPEGTVYRGDSDGRCDLIPVPVNLVPIIAPPAGAVGVLVLAVALFLAHRQRLQRLLRYAPTVPHRPVTIVMTDIQKSTELWGKYPEAMTEALAKHHMIIRKLLDKHCGYEVKTIGDAFFCVFGDALAAAEFAMQLQMALLVESWPMALEGHVAARTEIGDTGEVIFAGLRVRMGLHTAVVSINKTPHGGYSYDGPEVTVAMRVGDSGNGGQVLLTGAAYHAINRNLSGDIAYEYEMEYVGEYTFKDLDAPIHIHSIMPERLAERHKKFPPKLRSGMLRGEGGDAPESSMNNLRGSRTSEHGHLMAGIEKIRRWVAKCGSGGIPIVVLSALAIDAFGITGQDAVFVNGTLSVLHHVQNETSRLVEAGLSSGGGGSRLGGSVLGERSSTTSSTASYGNGVVTGGERLRWSTVLHWLALLPDRFVLRLAEHVVTSEPMFNANNAASCGRLSSSKLSQSMFVMPVTSRGSVSQNALHHPFAFGHFEEDEDSSVHDTTAATAGPSVMEQLSMTSISTVDTA